MPERHFSASSGRSSIQNFKGLVDVMFSVVLRVNFVLLSLIWFFHSWMALRNDTGDIR